MIETLNSNAGVASVILTLGLLTVTGFYAWTTHLLFKEARATRMLASQPRVVAYLRPNEVHANIVQLCIANLSSAAAVNVTAKIEQLTDWPSEFYLEDSKVLRDISFLRPNEVLKFDLGMGPDLFRDKKGAEFEITIDYASLDEKAHRFADNLNIESVEGFSSFQIYSIDDVARRLKEISDTIRKWSAFKQLRVEVSDSHDRLSRLDRLEIAKARVAERRERRLRKNKPKSRGGILSRR
ncbi:hypothetical protein [Parerythrobacter aestuarii]|uniref:hypothetical protein n=1 Tax=Parerythrobacter aestuarii TaxID=3020909 RepID=UPI0024DE9CFE|nr:hypothetical protein [Parerythrobacter aestuarii]